MRLLAIDTARLQDVAADAVKVARAIGADQAVATANAGAGVSVTARAGEVETALRNAGQTLTLTVYRDARAGTATTAAFDADAVRRAAEEAYAIAGLVGADPDALPPELADMAVDTPLPQIDAPADRDPSVFRGMALDGDALVRGMTAPAGVTFETVVSGLSSSEGATGLATSAGFCRGQTYSFHNAWMVALARDANGAANDSADSNDRRFDHLRPLHDVAALATARAAGQLSARSVPSQRAPVLFEARAAKALIGDLVAALSGNPQQRGATFLHNALGTSVAADHLDLIEDPYEPYGLASGGFDREGIAGHRRAILNGGVVEGYFLGTRSARRLGMVSTGSADGPWNLRLTSRSTGGDFGDLCRRMIRGLVVRGMTGGATDPVTGNWTYAVHGTWVEDGVPVHPVADVTVGGNMRDMLKAIVAVGTDVHRAGPYRTGSILIDDLQIGGAA